MLAIWNKGLLVNGLGVRKLTNFEETGLYKGWGMFSEPQDEEYI